MMASSAATPTYSGSSSGSSLEDTRSALLPEEESDDEDPIAALQRIKKFISDRDTPASKTGQASDESDESETESECSPIVQLASDESGDESDIGSECSAIHRGLLSYLEDKENLASAPKAGATLLDTPKSEFDKATPPSSTRKLLSSPKSSNRTPLAVKDPLDNQTWHTFSFDLHEEPKTPSPRQPLSNPNKLPSETPPQDEIEPKTPSPHRHIPNPNEVPFNTPSQDHHLSPEIKIASPPKKNDPYQWAYEVWTAHGLMGRRNGPTSSRKKFATASPPSDLPFKTPSPRYGNGSSSNFDVSDWDLSPLGDSMIKARNSSITRGADRAKECARQSTGNFQTVLSSWKKGRSETSKAKRELEMARRQAPENFQDLLRTWREARLEMMEDGPMQDGQKRAETYAREASTNLGVLVTTWQDKQTAEFEEWALEYARSPEEFQDLLRTWRQVPLENQTGEERAQEYAREANSNVDDIMTQWRESHTNEFEDWAREQAHSPDELQEILRQWRDSKHAVGTAEPRARCLAVEEKQASDESEMMQYWRESKQGVTTEERRDLHVVLEQEQASNNFEMLQQWRAVEHGIAAEEPPDLGTVAAQEHPSRRFENIMSIWQKSEVPDYEDWAESHARSPEELQNLLRVWREEKPEYAHDGDQSNHEFDTKLAAWRESGVSVFFDWAQENTESEEEFQNLLKQWHHANPVAYDLQHVRVQGSSDKSFNDEFATLVAKWRTFGSPDIEEWAELKATSSPAIQDMLRRWREDKPDFVSEQKPIQQSCLPSPGSTEASDRMPQEALMESWLQQKAKTSTDYEAIMRLWEEAKLQFVQDETSSLHCEESLLSSSEGSPVCKTQDDNVELSSKTEFTNRRTNCDPSGSLDIEEWVGQKAVSSAEFRGILTRWHEERVDFALCSSSVEQSRTLSKAKANLGSENHHTVDRHEQPQEAMMERWLQQKANVSPDYAAMLSLWNEAKLHISEDEKASVYLEDLHPPTKTENSGLLPSDEIFLTHSLELGTQRGKEDESFDLLPDCIPTPNRVESGLTVSAGTNRTEKFAGNSVSDFESLLASIQESELDARDEKQQDEAHERHSTGSFQTRIHSRKERRPGRGDFGEKPQDSGNASRIKPRATVRFAPDVLLRSNYCAFKGEGNADAADEESDDKTRAFFEGLLKIQKEVNPANQIGEVITVKSKREVAEDWNNPRGMQQQQREHANLDGISAAQDSVQRSSSDSEFVVDTCREKSIRLDAIEEGTSISLEDLHDVGAENLSSIIKNESPAADDTNLTQGPARLGPMLKANSAANAEIKVSTDSLRRKSDNFDGLMKRWKEAKPEVQTGEHRASSLARSANFENIRTNWADTDLTCENASRTVGKQRSEITASQRSSSTVVGNADSKRRRSGNLDDLKKQWKEAKPEIQTGQKRAAEFARKAKFENLRTNWLETQETSTGGEHLHKKSTQLTGQQRAQEFARDAAGKSVKKGSSWMEPNRETSKATGEPIHTTIQSTSKQRAADFARDTSGTVDGVRTKLLETKQIIPEGAGITQGHVKHSTGKQRAAEFARDASGTVDDIRTKFLDTELQTPKSTVAVQNQVKHSTGKQRAAEFARDATGNFDNIRTSFVDTIQETPNGLGPAQGHMVSESTGKLRAAEFARDASGNFDDIRTNWVETNLDTPEGAKPSQRNMVKSTGKRRAQEFAEASNLELHDLLSKFNNTQYSSLEETSGSASTSASTSSAGVEKKARSMPSKTPIAALIAALASDHAPLGASSSADDSEEAVSLSGSLFDEADIEVASPTIPEGEDPYVAPNGHLRTCACASSLFSGNDKLVEFFLPQLGMACTCGKDPDMPNLNADIADPTSIDLILRPWQCEFLKSFGIHRGDQLVKAHHRSAGVLAKAMKKWRKKHSLPRARTVSCGLALHIWSKTCKFEVRSVRKQIAMGVEVIKPNAVSVLSHLLAPQGDRRVSVPHSGRKRGPPEKLNENIPQVEI